MKNVPATVAALCIFNGLRISPVMTAPQPYRYKLPCAPVSPRFVQCERYLSRFFEQRTGPAVTIQDYMPLEVFNGQIAVAAWIRAAIGTLQYSFKQDGITIPDAHDIDPSLWFDDLVGFAMLYNDHAKPDEQYIIKSLASLVADRWEEDEHSATNKESNQFYIQQLYGQAGGMMERDLFLTSASSIIRARTVHALPPGQRYPFPL
jgi:hypothetical protein